MHTRTIPLVSVGIAVLLLPALPFFLPQEGSGAARAEDAAPAATPAVPVELVRDEALDGHVVWSYAFLVSPGNDLSGLLLVHGRTPMASDQETRARYTQAHIVVGDTWIGSAGGGGMAAPPVAHARVGGDQVATPGYGWVQGSMGMSQVPFSARDHVGLVRLVVLTSHTLLTIHLEAAWSEGVVQHGAAPPDPSGVLVRTLTDMAGGDRLGVQAAGSQGEDLWTTFSSRHGLLAQIYARPASHHMLFSCEAPPGSIGCRAEDDHGDAIIRLFTPTAGTWRLDVQEFQENKKQDPVLLIGARLPAVAAYLWVPGGRAS